jgi:hypothetical protein
MTEIATQATYHPAWNSLPTFLWVAVVLIIAFAFRSDLRSLFQIIVLRLRLGSSVKVWNLEIGQSYVEPGQAVARGGAISAVREDLDSQRWEERRQYYELSRNLLLVHRLAPSKKAGQLYDVLIYLMPHHSSDATLAGVKQVEYFLGRSWANSIFTSVDRARGFAIATSAYGPFMCTAEIHFSDGKKVMVNRYIDFEMGPLPSVEG